jgi:hypothetical protein
VCPDSVGARSDRRGHALQSSWRSQRSLLAAPTMTRFPPRGPPPLGAPARQGRMGNDVPERHDNERGGAHRCTVRVQRGKMAGGGRQRPWSSSCAQGDGEEQLGLLGRGRDRLVMRLTMKKWWRWRDNGAGARRRARRPELGGTSSAAPRGFSGTCSK